MAISRHDIEELYSIGQKVNVAPPGHDPVTVFFRKINSPQQQKAVRKANAARIRLMQVMNRPDTDDEKMSIVGEVEELAREDKIVYLTELQVATYRPKIEQELSEEKEWAEEGYLQSLIDAFDDEALLDYMKGDEERSVETQELFDQMKRFTDAVDGKLEIKRGNSTKHFEAMSDDQLTMAVTKSYLEREAGIAWLRVFRDHQILFGVENLETGEKIYSSIGDIDNIPTELYQIYLGAIEETSVPVTELKS